MAGEFSVSLKKILDETQMQAVYMPADPATLLVTCSDLNRPGLVLAGFLEFFDDNRIQVLGKSEFGFIDGLEASVRHERLQAFVSEKPPAIVVTRSIDVPDDLLELCQQYGVPLLHSPEATSALMAAMIAFLNIELAPRVTRHGVLVEVYGEGILLAGDSGVGKSETAIELVKRGHRLIADDAVEIRRVSSKTLVGSAPENIRHFIELRGIGIVNARRLFGIGSVKVTEKIDMVLNLEQWNHEKVYDRMGLENEYTEILGNTVPMLTIPVKPGRNLAVIIEVAAMNNRQKKMGYNAAKELMHHLGLSEEMLPETDGVKIDWDKF